MYKKKYCKGKRIKSASALNASIRSKTVTLFWQDQWRRPVHVGWLVSMQYSRVIDMVMAGYLFHVKKIK